MSNSLLILITIISWGVGSLFYKLANDNIHPLMVSALVTSLYAALVPIGVYLFKVNTTLNTPGVTYALVGGICMCIGTFAYFFALRNGGAGQITASTAVYPAITLILSAFILKEEITWPKIIGCIFALASVFLLSK